MVTAAKQLDVLAPNSLVLVTGANGYLASQVVDQLLALGLRVRGSVRQAKPWLDELYTKRHGSGKFESIVVPDLSNADDVKKAITDVDGIVHVASDTSFNGDPNKVIPGVIASIEQLLKTAAAVPSVRRVVLTSSSTAAIVPVTDKEGVKIDENTWNEEYVKLAWNPSAKPESNGFPVYAASKTQGEQAAWKWVKENKPQFVFNAVLPNTITGEILDENIAGSTQGWINGLLKGDLFAFNILVPQYNVDVRDVARLHVVALTGQGVENKRIFGFSHPFNHTSLLEILRRARPDNTLLPPAPENEGHDLTEVVPAKEAEQLLRDCYGQTGWTSFEDSIRKGIERA